MTQEDLRDFPFSIFFNCYFGKEINFSAFSPSVLCSGGAGVPGAFQPGRPSQLWPRTRGWLPPALPGRALRQGHPAVLQDARHLQRPALRICEFSPSFTLIPIPLSHPHSHHYPSQFDFQLPVIGDRNKPLTDRLCLQERYNFPNRILIGKRRCHTSNILTPEDKGHAQKLGVSGPECRRVMWRSSRDHPKVIQRHCMNK